MTKNPKFDEGSTAHKHVPGPTDAAAPSGADAESMPMGMTGTSPQSGDPDQKSTHVSPKTVEAVLPDGSPKFADPGKQAKAPKPKAGKYRVLSPIRTGGKTHEAGAEIELDADEAASLGENVESV